MTIFNIIIKTTEMRGYSPNPLTFKINIIKYKIYYINGR